MNKLIFAVDYDGTYSADPALFSNFIDMVQKAGHEVICVTMRYRDIPKESEPVLNSIGKLCEVIFTNREAKSWHCANRGIYPDIWIDDEPHFLFKNG